MPEQSASCAHISGSEQCVAVSCYQQKLIQVAYVGLRFQLATFVAPLSYKLITWDAADSSNPLILTEVFEIFVER